MKLRKATKQGKLIPSLTFNCGFPDYYLEDKLHVPFLTRCIQERAISPLRVGDEVEVVGMAPEDECQREMFVETPWEHKRTLAVPLSQLEVVQGDEETRQAVEDWHYWVGMGYGF